MCQNEKMYQTMYLKSHVAYMITQYQTIGTHLETRRLLNAHQVFVYKCLQTPNKHQTSTKQTPKCGQICLHTNTIQTFAWCLCTNTIQTFANKQRTNSKQTAVCKYLFDAGVLIILLNQIEAFYLKCSQAIFGGLDNLSPIC